MKDLDTQIKKMSRQKSVITTENMKPSEEFLMTQQHTTQLEFLVTAYHAVSS